MTSREGSTRIVQGRRGDMEFTVEARQGEAGQVRVERVLVAGESVAISHLEPQGSMNAALELGAHVAKSEIDDRRTGDDQAKRNSEDV